MLVPFNPRSVHVDMIIVFTKYKKSYDYTTKQWVKEANLFRYLVLDILALRSRWVEMSLYDIHNKQVVKRTFSKSRKDNHRIEMEVPDNGPDNPSAG